MCSATMQLLKTKQKEKGMSEDTQDALDKELEAANGNDEVEVEFELPDAAMVSKMKKAELDELYEKLQFVEGFDAESMSWHKLNVGDKKSKIISFYDVMKEAEEDEIEEEVETSGYIEEVVEEEVEAQEIKPATIKKASKPTKGDLISDAVNFAENIGSEQEAIDKFHEYSHKAGTNAFYQGGILSKLQAEGWWNGYEKFNDFVSNELEMESRKARYLIDIYEALVSLELTWEQVGHVGWKKLGMIAKKMTQDNWEDWIEKASSMTVPILQEYLTSLNNGMDEGEAAEKATSLKTKTFKLHPDQFDDLELALEKAKEEAGTEYDSVALENICGDYMSGGKKKPEKTPEEILTQVELDSLIEYTIARVQEEVEGDENQFNKLIGPLQSTYPSMFG